MELKSVTIDDAEFLNRNSSNALLKIIEEPNPNTITTTQILKNMARRRNQK